MHPVRAVRAYLTHAWAAGPARERVFTLVAALLAAALALAPTGFERPAGRELRARVRVLEVDDAGVKNYGVLLQGEQYARISVLSGAYRGLEAEAHNILYGKSDLDKVYRAGDVALAVIYPYEDGSVSTVTLMDHWRVGWQLALVGTFFVVLIAFGGWIGLKSFVSFALTGTVLWKILIPAFLAGVPPALASLSVVAVLSFFIIFLIAGFNRTGAAAFLGSMAGTAMSAAYALALAGPYRLNGAVRSFSETLRFGGYEHLSMTQIFLAGTFLASSGAFMDLAMDVAAAVEEIHAADRGLDFVKLAKAGLNVGRKVIGTMSTTLLLAYTGGFTSLLMVFMAQGVPAVHMFTMSYVSSEVFHTMIGSIGLVLIAPLTAVFAAWFGSRSGRIPAA